MKQKITVEHKTMPVKGGEAWVEITRYRKRKPVRWTRLERDPDGKIRKHKYVYFSKGNDTGGCPECNQMPCPHTAKLLGWACGWVSPKSDDRHTFSCVLEPLHSGMHKDQLGFEWKEVEK